MHALSPRRQWSTRRSDPLNGIEISCSPADRDNRRSSEQQVDDVLFPWLRSYPYTTIYIAYMRERKRRRRRRTRASDKALTDIVQEPAGSPRFNLEDD